MPSVAKASNKPYVRLATIEDAAALAPRLRNEDLQEIAHGSGMKPAIALLHALSLSNIAYAVMKGDKVIALFGIVEELHWEEQGRGKGYPWMLASPELKSIRKSFLRECREYVLGWLGVHKELEGFVWTGNGVHIQWLQWLGFTFDAPAPYGKNNEPFQRFSMKEVNEGIGGA